MLDGKNNDLSLRWEVNFIIIQILRKKKKNCIVLPTNMAAVSRGCKPRINSFDIPNFHLRFLQKLINNSFA